ncbi:hypothetical protein [Streptomyces ehimensis]|uniref:Aminoglycoside phosphotransferase domain-containing protein n=1 Tax=Streptomyces ehimensis TaxID=68195 RepID=A0ABV9BVI7_9ACTN
MAFSSSPVVDLRRVPVDGVLNRVENALQTGLVRDTVVRKRRSVGARTERGTWVRIERRPLDRIDGQGWNGAESAGVLRGVAMPRWLAGIEWREDGGVAAWRADETELVTASPVRSGGQLAADPKLPGSWWTTLNTSLNALASQHTTRIATPDTVTITQASVTETIRGAFPNRPVDTAISRWTPAHADLNWANVTGPECWLLDWEDWGMAPRSLDSATLWSSSLAIPSLADQVRRERRHDLASRDGRLMGLFCCAKLLAYPDDADPRLRRARREADRLLAELGAPTLLS